VAKQLLFEDRARLKLQRGVNTLADAVAVTLGPTGRNVIIDKSFGNPLVTKDGVTVSKEVELDDPFEHMGAKLVNEVATKTSDIAGDGTTTATVLAKAIYAEGLRSITLGANPTVVRRGLEKAAAAAIEHFKSAAKPVDSPEEIAQVGAISANNDRSIGDLLAEAMQKVGRDGVITVEEGKGNSTTLKLAEGMQFDKGFISPYFVTDPAEMKAILEDCYILLHEKKISSLRDLVPLLEKIAQSGKPLLIVAEDVDGEALTALVVNKLRGVLRVCAVKAPGFGDRRKAMLGDMAVLTGGTLLSEDLGVKLESVEVAHLGRCKKIEVTKDTCTLIEGGGKSADIQTRVAQIRLATIAEARGLDRTHPQHTPQLVDDQRGQRLAVDIFGNDQQGLARLGDLLEQRNEIPQAGDLLLVQQDVAIFEDRLHLSRIGDEVRRDEALVELHPLGQLEGGGVPLPLFDGDHTVAADLLHRFGEQVADRAVVVRRDGADLGDLFRAVDRLGGRLEVLDRGGGRLLEPAANHRGVGPQGDAPQPFGVDRLGEDGRGGGSVTGDVAGLGRHLVDQLGTHVLERVVQLDFLRDGHAVLGDERIAEALVDDDVAAGGAEGHRDSVGQGVHAALQLQPGTVFKQQLLCHAKNSCGGSLRRGNNQTSLARMSLSRRIFTSLPSTSMSVPPYLLNSTWSPTATARGARSPDSSSRPGPTAVTLPRWGFSLAVSGRTMPPAVVVSASTG